MKTMFQMIAGLVMLGAGLHAQEKTPILRMGASDLITVRTQVRFTTLIQLPDGEEISEVTCGDSEWWVIEGKGAIVHIKPSKEGAQTNVNIVAQTGAIYSFLVREITRAGGAASKEKPDLRIHLGDDLTKLRKDKENLEEVLSRTEKELSKAKEQAPAKKIPTASPDAPANQYAPAQTLPEIVIPEFTPQVPAADLAVVPAVPPEPDLSEIPIATVHKIERRDGAFPLLGRFLHRVGKILHLY